MTTPRFRRGLVVGKFSPLHLGHEHVIRTALAGCDEVIVLSYSKPEFARCEAAVREHWLARRVPAARLVVFDDARLALRCRERQVPVRSLPANDADAGVHRAFVGWVLATLCDATVDAVFTSESYGDGFAASLTRQFRIEEPALPAVAHVCVDLARAAFPVSGRAAREAPSAARDLLAPEVFADLVPRLCLLGGESTGKTTLAEALAHRLGTVAVAEHGRERWLELGGGVLGPAELLGIARTQVAREIAAAPHARGWLVCDTSPLTTLVYGLLDHVDVPAELHTLAHRRYDLVVVCAADFAFEQDGTRRDDAFRQHQQARTIAWLEQTGTPFVRVHGTVEQRIEQIEQVMTCIERSAPDGERR